MLFPYMLSVPTLAWSPNLSVSPPSRVVRLFQKMNWHRHIITQIDFRFTFHFTYFLGWDKCTIINVCHDSLIRVFTALKTFCDMIFFYFSYLGKVFFPFELKHMQHSSILFFKKKAKRSTVLEISSLILFGISTMLQIKISQSVQ